MIASLRDRVAHLPHRVIVGWLVRILLIAAVIRVTAHRPPHVVVGPVQTVETQHPIMCVHTRLTDEVEEWKIQRSLQMVREMGATAIVEYFPWAYIEPEQGVYNWWHSDMVIDHANAQGLTVIARLGLVPQWAQPCCDETDADYSLTHLTPDRYYDFGEFVRVFAGRYAGRVDHIIIWNEPNLAYEWGYQEVLPQQYVSVMDFAYSAAHDANPDVTILAGALAPTLEPPGSQYGMNEIDYLTGLYEWGISRFYDALAIHTYGFKFPPEEPPAADVLNFRRAELLREIMVANSDAEKPVYITESGWNDHPRWTKAVRPGQRIEYTLGALQYAEENWPWAENVCIWALRYPAPTYNYADYFTLVGADFTPKPIYEELQAWARGE